MAKYRFKNNMKFRANPETGELQEGGRDFRLVMMGTIVDYDKTDKLIQKEIDSRPEMFDLMEGPIQKEENKTPGKSEGKLKRRTGKKKKD